MSNLVLRSLSKKVEGNLYSTMNDEYIDCSNHEQLTFCLRWVKSLKAHETFLGLYEIPGIKSSTTVSVIKDILTRCQLSMENVRGQCYDGASNMLGKTSVVSEELQKLQPKVNYTHCHAHSFSLSVKDITKKVKTLGDTMGTAREVIVLINYSPKRENILGKIKEQIECYEEVEIKANSISKLSQARWTDRTECFKRILDNYKELMTLWKFCLENDNMATEVKSRIVRVKKQMEKFDFFFGLNIGHRVYSHINNLFETVQAEKMSACTSKRTAELLVSVLEGLRNEDSFKSLFQIITDNASTIDFIEQPGPPRKSKAPQYSILHYVIDGNQSAAQTHHPLTVEDRYRESYFEAVDNMISAIRERFKQPSFEA